MADRPPGWAGVLFDLDGTLADTVPLILASWRHTMERHRGEAPADHLWLRHVGRPLWDSMAEFASGHDECDAMIDTYVAFQRGAHDRMVSPFAGAADVLRTVRRRGARVAIVTSKGREIAERTVAHCALDPLVEVMVTADDVEHGKPHPEPVRRAVESLGLVGRESRVLFVGDSPHDMRAGRAAGVRTAAATWGPFAREDLEATEPDLWVSRLDDVLRLEP